MESRSDSARPASRSYLFVPGDRPERFDKAWASDADEVVIDLEDAVPPQRKLAAREAIAAWLRPGRAVWVRMNASDSEWFAGDLLLARQSGLAGFMLPKAEVLPEPLLTCCGVDQVPVIALIETAEGMRRAHEIACQAPVQRLAFGSLDFQAELDITGDDEALLYFRSHLVLQSRLAARAAPIDGVTLAIDDLATVRSDAARARRLGFGAKLCIHPRQAPEVNAAFTPDAAQRDWAARVLQAMEESGGAAVAVDGKMVDRPLWLKARRIAASAAAPRRQAAGLDLR